MVSHQHCPGFGQRLKSNLSYFYFLNKYVSYRSVIAECGTWHTCFSTPNASDPSAGTDGRRRGGRGAAAGGPPPESLGPPGDRSQSAVGTVGLLRFRMRWEGMDHDGVILLITKYTPNPPPKKNRGSSPPPARGRCPSRGGSKQIPRPFAPTVSQIPARGH